MRDEIIRDRKITINPLTRKQIRGLKDLGFGPAFFRPDMETLNDAWEAVFPMALSKKDVDFLEECAPAETIPIWRAILAETYSTPEEEKNLPSTGDGTPTAIE